MDFQHVESVGLYSAALASLCRTSGAGIAASSAASSGPSWRPVSAIRKGR
jgi:hypothetical protein